MAPLLQVRMHRLERQTPNYTLDFVIRQAYGNNVYGEKILTSPAAGTTYEKVVSMTVDAAWNQNVYIVACLWKYDATGNPASNIPKYKYINGIREN